jgi:hypothetical protein
VWLSKFMPDIRVPAQSTPLAGVVTKVLSPR